jgi:hypothetical protein
MLERFWLLRPHPLEKSLEFVFDKSILIRLHYFQYEMSY